MTKKYKHKHDSRLNVMANAWLIQLIMYNLLKSESAFSELESTLTFPVSR